MDCGPRMAEWQQAHKPKDHSFRILNGHYDALALELANNLTVLGLTPEEFSRPAPTLV